MGQVGADGGGWVGRGILLNVGGGWSVLLYTAGLIQGTQGWLREHLAPLHLHPPVSFAIPVSAPAISASTSVFMALFTRPILIQVNDLDRKVWGKVGERRKLISRMGSLPSDLPYKGPLIGCCCMHDDECDRKKRTFPRLELGILERIGMHCLHAVEM